MTSHLVISFRSYADLRPAHVIGWVCLALVVVAVVVRVRWRGRRDQD